MKAEQIPLHKARKNAHKKTPPEGGGLQRRNRGCQAMSARGLRPLSRARGRCWWSRFPGFRRRSPSMVAQGGGIVKPHPGRRFSARVALPAEIGGAGGWLIPPRRSAGLPMLIAKQGSSATRSRLHRRRKTTPARAAAPIAAGRSCFAACARTARPDFPQRGRAGLARLLARRCAPLGLAPLALLP